MAKLTLVPTAPTEHTPENIAQFLIQSFKAGTCEESVTQTLQRNGITPEEFDAFIAWRIENPAKLEDFY